MKTLVIGGDSLIGRSILADRELFTDSIGTSRRTGAAYYVDLADSQTFKVKDAKRFDSAIVCAGITRLAQCKADPVYTAHINVMNSFNLIRRLSQEYGLFTVWLSSSCVFNGEIESPGIDTPVSPNTEYGRQKAALEHLIKGLANTAILRLSKVTESLFIADKWKADLMAGRVIQPLSDYRFSDVPLSTVRKTIHRIIQRRATGIHHCSGLTTCSYSDLAYQIADSIGADKALVQPQTIADSGLAIEHQRKHDTLLMSL